MDAANVVSFAKVMIVTYSPNLEVELKLCIDTINRKLCKSIIWIHS